MGILIAIVVTFIIMWCYMQHRLDCENVYAHIVSLRFHGHPDVKISGASKHGFRIEYGNSLEFYSFGFNKQLFKRLHACGIDIHYEE